MRKSAIILILLAFLRCKEEPKSKGGSAYRATTGSDIVCKQNETMVGQCGICSCYQGQWVCPEASCEGSPDLGGKYKPSGSGNPPVLFDLTIKPGMFHPQKPVLVTVTREDAEKEFLPARPSLTQRQTN